jgi:3D (Asp-Asp-Asp) domain-containing protein
VELVDGGAMRVFYSASPTLGLALWDAGIHLLQGDHLSLPLNTPLLTPVVLTLRRALPITIQTGAVQVTALSAAPAVGEALAESGLSLQGSDYSQPAEDQPIPPDGLIRIVRVREEVLLQQTTIPFENEYVSDPQTPLDQTSVVQAGQAGLLVSRVRVRYEDGTETGRQTEAQWTANQPVTQKIGTGSKINVQTLDTPGGPIEYWRAVNVYATSYSPCRSGTSKCYGFTASGQPVTRGVIGVTTRWYSVMGGQQVYIPGYGRAVIADTGGGIPGKKWIDLGFSDDDYESWAQNVTLYFLTPIPANVPYILP